MLFSLFQTLCLWNINARDWLLAYLQACATAGGKPPSDPESFLPWRLSEERRREWALRKIKEKQTEDSS